MKFRRLPVLRVLIVRPRLMMSIAIGCLIGFGLPSSFVPHAITRLLIGWNVAAITYCALAIELMTRATRAHMRLNACTQDEGKYTILTLVLISSVLTLFATAVEMSAAKDVHGTLKAIHVALAGLTVFTTWWVNQIMFALHYAHDYYRHAGRKDRGLMFPGTAQPDYFDFLYAAAIIGTSGQTADVSFNTSPTRRLAMVHSVLAFFFNTIVLALTINFAAGLL